MEQVETFRYLGVNINNKGYYDAEINATLQISTTGSESHLLRRGKLQKRRNLQYTRPYLHQLGRMLDQDDQRKSCQTLEAKRHERRLQGT